MTNKKIVYIAHPIGGDVEGNLAKLREVVRGINKHYSNIIPFVPYYSDVVSMDDNNPADRERGISNNLQVLSSGVVDALWVIGDKVTKGMQSEIDTALMNGTPCHRIKSNFDGTDFRVDHITSFTSDMVLVLQKHGSATLEGGNIYQVVLDIEDFLRTSGKFNFKKT